MNTTSVRHTQLLTVFNALDTATVACHRISGEDAWRVKDEYNPRMRLIDSELMLERLEPPSKPRADKKPQFASVWTKIHFSILLPALRRLKQVYTIDHNSHQLLRELTISKDDISSYLNLLPDLVCALKRYQQMQQLFRYVSDLIKDSVADDAGQCFISRLSEFAQNHPTSEQSFEIHLISAFVDQIHAHGDNFNYGLFSKVSNAEELFIAILNCLPDSPSDLVPFFLELIEKGTSENDSVGRLVQYYYGLEKKIPFSDLGIIEESGHFFGTGLNLFQRYVQFFFQQLTDCPVKLVDGEGPEYLSVKTVFDLYGDWYQRPKVVEMVLPNFKGAGQNATKLITSLMDLVKEKTGGVIDCSTIKMKTRKDTDECSEGTEDPDVINIDILIVQLAKDIDALRRFGRLAMFVETIGNGAMHDCLGVPVTDMHANNLLTLAYDVWDDATRKQVWGHSLRYIPSEENFARFQQDVVSIIYASALNIGDNSKSEDDIQLVQELKLLSENMLLVSDMRALKSSLRASQHMILRAIGVIRSLEKTSVTSGSSRSLVFVYRSCIGSMNPVRIPIDDLASGFNQIQVNEEDGIRTLCMEFREANDSISFKLTKRLDTIDKIVTAKYIALPIQHGGLAYPDHYLLQVQSGQTASTSVVIPKIGRESYDILGETGSAHAGLVIGYGCSVFHTSLQFAQVVAAIFGFHEEEHLKTIQSKFFEINPGLHLRRNLAAFHTEQLLRAIQQPTANSLTYKQYVLEHHMSLISEDALHKHVQSFVTGSDRDHEFDYYHQRIAFLQYHYPDLYPFTQEEKEFVNPRTSFYDGSCVMIQNPINHEHAQQKLL